MKTICEMSKPIISLQTAYTHVCHPTDIAMSDYHICQRIPIRINTEV